MLWLRYLSEHSSRSLQSSLKLQRNYQGRNPRSRDLADRGWVPEAIYCCSDPNPGQELVELKPAVSSKYDSVLAQSPLRLLESSNRISPDFPSRSTQYLTLTSSWKSGKKLGRMSKQKRTPSHRWQGHSRHKHRRTKWLQNNHKQSLKEKYSTGKNSPRDEEWGKMKLKIFGKHMENKWELRKNKWELWKKESERELTGGYKVQLFEK